MKILILMENILLKVCPFLYPQMVLCLFPQIAPQKGFYDMLNKQIRFYGNNNSQNYPGEITLELLHNGSAFLNIYPIMALNI